MGSADGRVLGGPVKILDNGPDDQRFNIVIAGDGYVYDPSAAEPLKDFHDFCTGFIAHLQSRPWYPVIGRVFNVHRLDVASNDVGADMGPPCFGVPAPVTVNTYFDGFVECTGPYTSWVQVNWGWAKQVFDQHFPGYGCAAVAVNTTWGGGRTVNRVISFGAGASGSYDVLLHEMGHAIAPLMDNYVLAGGTAPAGVEPWGKNQTAERDLSKVRWRHWFGVQPGDPPVMLNPDCAFQDLRPNPFGDDHLVGLFESSGYYCGWFRPTYACRMRDASKEFCPVCLELMHAALSTYATPTTNFQVAPTEGGYALEFGLVEAGSTVTRTFEVRNLRIPGFWPTALDVTLSVTGANFSFPAGAELTFRMPAPIEKLSYSRTVEVAFTAPATGAEQFRGEVAVWAQGVPIPLTLDLHATSAGPTVEVGVVAIDPQDAGAFYSAVSRRDYVGVMSAVFERPHPLGTIEFPEDSGVPVRPSAVDGVKARFSSVFPIPGYRTLATYFSRAGDTGAGSAEVQAARRQLVERATTTASSGAAGSIAAGSFEVGADAFEVARQNGVTSSAIMIVDALPTPVNTAVVAVDPQHTPAYLRAVFYQDFVTAMREALQVERRLGDITFLHDSAVPSDPGALEAIRTSFLAQFPAPVFTFVAYFVFTGHVFGEAPLGTPALRDARRELVRQVTWSAASGSAASIADSSYTVGADVFAVAVQHHLPYDAIMVVQTLPGS